MITVVSVPYTGTHFTLDFLRKLGAPASHVHIGNVQGRIEGPVVIPLRHPDLSAISHRTIHQANSPSKFGGDKWESARGGLEEVVEHWQMLENFCQEHNYVTLPVDCPPEWRVRALRRVADYAGVRFNTAVEAVICRIASQWEPLNQHPSATKELFLLDGMVPYEADALSDAVRFVSLENRWMQTKKLIHAEFAHRLEQAIGYL